MSDTIKTMDGNQAVADVAYRINEVCAIYPITPSSPMAELADQWAASGRTNLWGQVPFVQEMQSEGGAAGAVHGALQSGALTTTFTASQGLLLMIPNMFKIAGELTPTVFHVAARALATQALSIFGDHQDVMATRSTGFAILGAATVQEAHDLALIAQAATLASRIPFVHFMDGFRTSHEVGRVEVLDDSVLRAMIDDTLVRAHRSRALSPERPAVRGTAHNPDTFFQARETVNPYYQRVPQIVQDAMNRFGELTGRTYSPFEYEGPDDAERVVVAMGSGAIVVRETARWLRARGEKVGSLHVRLYRPFDTDRFLAALPKSCRAVAVLDRCKEPGGTGEPLYNDVVSAFAQGVANGTVDEMPTVVGGRYGLGSKEFDPGMAKAVFEALDHLVPPHGFTVGIDDDVGGTSLEWDRELDIEPAERVHALFFGLGADGTVGANKNSVKILGEDPDRHAQGYFVYDSRKSGSETVSHLRFGPRPIDAPWLVRRASFIACHQFELLHRRDVLASARDGATLLLNAPFAPDELWDKLPARVQGQIIERRLKVYCINATAVAKDAGLGRHTNSILQTCFFALSGVIERNAAIERIKAAIQQTYARKGQALVERNFQAVDSALEHLHELPVPKRATAVEVAKIRVPEDAPRFVQDVTAELLAGRGDDVPVSRMPVDGTWPTGTTQYEKRNIASDVPVWDPALCIQCGQCAVVCPHSVIRAKCFEDTLLKDAPPDFPSAPVNARGYPGKRYALQVYVEDCTGCGVCVEQCPAVDPDDSARRAINLAHAIDVREHTLPQIDYFESLPAMERTHVDFANVRGVQFLEPRFEFSGACAGCGETPYLKMLSQLFGDRLQIANATGCSSIYGGNLPTTPWSQGPDGRGPAWSNSLFEDNAEFGLGFRLAVDQQTDHARHLLESLRGQLDGELVDAVLTAPQVTESDLAEQRKRLEALAASLAGLDDPAAVELRSVLEFLLRRSVWIVGGDGWAYDIGYGGLDHVLAQNRDVNVLVLDTEVYSNTGGQSSKATPLAASAKFASAGKRIPRKDLGLQAISYGYVYVAQVCLGASPEHTLLALREAEAYRGPSLVLAYSQCIAHGIDLRFGMKQAARAVASGHWPLFRYDPTMRQRDLNPFRLDSPRPRLTLKDFAYRELRYRVPTATHPEDAAQLMVQAQAAVDERYRYYEDLAARDGSRFSPHWEDA